MSLILMYVYFDKRGDIKAITPSLDDALAEVHSVATFPVSEVQDFLTGAQSTFEYTIIPEQKGESMRYILSKKVRQNIFTRSLDNYLTKISEKQGTETLINITNNTANKTLCISLSTLGLNLKEGNSNEIFELEKKGISFIYLTKKNNPFELRYTMQFYAKLLVEQERIYYNYTGDFSNSSAYAKKIIKGYRYIEKD